MFAQIIYEKTFPKDPALEALQKQQAAVSFHEQQGKFPSFPDMMADLERKTTYIPRPYRIRRRKRFIHAAIALANFYGIDLTVTQSKGLISATFYFDACAGMQNLSNLMGMADEFEFLTNIHGCDICMTLNYYTHKIIRNRIVISP